LPAFDEDCMHCPAVDRPAHPGFAHARMAMPVEELRR
jgi:hypothetical protein